jgi:DNA repair protein RadD
MQMAGRGLRPKSHTDHCLVLDFAGVVETHGPITAVNPPNKKKDGDGEPPVKVCASCGELVHISKAFCPACGAPFPPPKKPKLALRDADIMGLDSIDMSISDWRWREHVSKASGKRMIAVDYYGAFSDPVVTEYFTILHDGYSGATAAQKLAAIAAKSGAVNALKHDDLGSICAELNFGRKPQLVSYKKDGKFFRVTRREF